MATFLCFLVLTIASNVLAHMQLYYPAPFNASNNPHKTTAADPYLVFPYNCCGEGARWKYPCRGYHSLLGTPDGAPTATWAAGSQQHWSIAGTESSLGGNHYGGSCQVGFSVNHGETFHMATSYEGNCPHRDGGIEPENQDFQFTVPHDLVPGVQLFAWIWYNRETEYNMNCAAVEITAGNESTSSQSAPGSYGQGMSTATGFPTTSTSSESGPDSYGPGSPTTTASSSSATPTTYKTTNGLSCVCEDPKDISTCNCDCANQSSNHAKRNEQARNQLRDTIPFSSRPLMLVADEGNGCKTPKTHAELKFPDPGPDVVAGDGVYPLQLPEGNCAGGGK